MTQILSFLCKRFIAQVSDRRLTKPDGTLYDDYTNKSVIYDGRSCFSYAGLSELEGEPTYEWLAKALSEQPANNMKAAVHDLARRATTAVRSSGIKRKYRGLTFVAVAWVIPRDTREPTAMGIQISNSAHGAIENQFAVEFFPIGPKGPAWLLLDAGVPLAERDRERATAMVRHRMKHRSVPQSFVESMVGFVRDSANADSRISSRVLSALIPRSAVEAGHSLLAVTGPLIGETGVPTFQYWEDGKWNGITYGPAVAGPGLVMTNFQSGPLLPGLGGLTTRNGGFTVTYPVAILLSPTNDVLATTQDDKTYIAAFSDSSLMAEFIRTESPSARPFFIETPDHFREVMGAFSASCDVVAFNPNGETSQRMNVDIDEILRTPPGKAD